MSLCCYVVISNCSLLNVIVFKQQVCTYLFHVLNGVILSKPLQIQYAKAVLNVSELFNHVSLWLSPFHVTAVGV